MPRGLALKASCALMLTHNHRGTWYQLPAPAPRPHIPPPCVRIYTRRRLTPFPALTTPQPTNAPHHALKAERDGTRRLMPPAAPFGYVGSPSRPLLLLLTLQPPTATICASPTRRRLTPFPALTTPQTTVAPHHALKAERDGTRRLMPPAPPSYRPGSAHFRRRWLAQTFCTNEANPARFLDLVVQSGTENKR